MDICPWKFSFREASKLFFTRYARTFLSIAIVGVLWVLYGKEISTELFVVFSTPEWMLPFCLFVAADIFTRMVNEVLFTYE